MPFGSRDGPQRRRRKHVRAGVDGYASGQRREARRGDLDDALRGEAAGRAR